MMRMAGQMVRMAGAVLLAGLCALGPEFGLEFGQVQAADLFAPAVTVNGTVITGYELDQRQKFLKALRQTGDLSRQAEDGLISDRLQQDAAKQLGVTVSADDITAGLAEFAGRAKLSTEDFLKAVAVDGVEPETVRDFVKSGLLWRAALRAKFAGRIRVSEAEVDRAIAGGAASGGAEKVLLSEIVLPDDGTTDVAALAARIRAKVKSANDFAQMARAFSKVPSAKAGGALNWLEVTTLPPAVAGAIAALKPGEMTGPVPQQGAVTLYFLREVSQSAGPAKGAAMVDYALFTPAAGTDLARVQAQVTGCDGLNPLARGLGETALQRQTVAEAALPAGLRGTVAGLDAGESAIVDGGRQLVMLCARRPGALADPSRADVRETLVNQKLALLADSWLEELRSDAIILRP